MTAETTEVEWFTGMQVGDDWRRVLVTAEVTGRYRPATWGYAGGDPPEGPEVTITSVAVEAGEDDEGRPLTATDVDPLSLAREVREGLEDYATELAEERRARRTYGDEW